MARAGRILAAAVGVLIIVPVLLVTLAVLVANTDWDGA